MNFKKLLYLPLSFPFFIIIIILGLLFLVATIFVGAITRGFEKIGFSAMQAFFLFLFSLIGSAINIPLYEEKTERSSFETKNINFMGIRYPIPTIENRINKTTIAVNVGGAIVPIMASLYIIVSNSNILPMILISTSIISLISYKIATPVKGVGITMPTFLPPILAVLISIILAPNVAPQLAYSSGVLGVLIGADILNLSETKKLRAPVVSIGGAGTFDGIFLTGIVAALIAPIGF